MKEAGLGVSAPDRARERTCGSESVRRRAETTRTTGVRRVSRRELTHRGAHMQTPARTSEQYYANVRAQMHELDKALGRLARVPLPGVLDSDEVKKLRRARHKAKAAIEQLLATVGVLEQTPLNVVDLQMRMKQEVRQLVTPLKSVDILTSKAVEHSEPLKRRLIELEAQAQHAAGALFPSCIRGLSEINDLIWLDLRPKVLGDFKRERQRQKDKKKWSAARQIAVRRASNDVESAFRDLRTFLHTLATTQVDEATLREGVRAHRAAMAAVADQARVLKKDKKFSGFKGILDQLRRIATEARGRLLELDVPLFPTWKDLEALQPLIEKDLYNGLAGAQKFALLNIAARLQSVVLGEVNLLDPVYQTNIWLVFPDRIYMRAKTDLIRTVSEHPNEFNGAPAGLHRFGAGSFKQAAESKGGLQLSFAPKLEEATRHVNVDADIDLFKRPLSHFFGEVLVNHLTGNTTSQYKVHEILRKRNIATIGGFKVVRTASLA